MEKIKIIKIIISSLFCLIFFLPAPAAQVSYYDIINQQDPRLYYVNNSSFAQSFVNFSSPQQKIDHLLSYGQKKDDKFYNLEIKDIPTIIPNKTSTLILEIKYEHPNNIELSLHEKDKPVDQYRNKMSWQISNEKSVLEKLSARPDITGSTIMRIWDGLCWLCTIGKVSLIDRTSLPDQPLELKLLYRYIWGQTFYERFGFIPKLSSDKEYRDYYAAVNFLINRPLTEILKDFDNNTEVYNALLQGFNKLSLFPEHSVPLEKATLKDALNVPYVRILTLKQGQLDPITHKNADYYVQILKTITSNCIERYTSTKDIEKTEKIKAAQIIINLNEEFVKYYKIK